ncbi:nuclease-related domain-containing protein [Cognatilysobacter segetis]|uniref:nuclease-related domain-containing protein n=1 Tax=Cognatilysobacter segetis TaxID=2492394 RepID=UPI00105B7CE3|nr:nuclease-related domain-containing protein [Lysobacter segetis]
MRILIMIGAMVGPLLLLLGLLFAWRFIADRDRRRSPLNFKLLNLPGDGLRRRIEHHDEKMNDAALAALMTGPFLLIAWALTRLSRIPSGLRWNGGDWFYVVLALVTVGWSAYRVVRHGKQRRRCRQGFDAERAVAQNLIPLMAEGCMVFHDFPADRFNIDHIVVAPHVVYAVETKSRRKPSTGGKAAARVGYDGRALAFPTHVETKPVEQAKAQAEWLRRFLSSAVGEPVGVVPVLALPGWYVDLSREGSRAEVIVNNLRSPLFLMKIGAGKPDPIRQKRIAHALAERYPALED